MTPQKNKWFFETALRAFLIDELIRDERL